MDIFDPKELALLQVDPDENASLETLLTKRNLPLLELFSIKNIQSKIRSNFNFFIKYCQKNEDFCFNLIDIGIKCPMHQGANDNMKQACYIAADVLTCDQDVVAELLILPDKAKPKRKDSGEESDQFEEIQQNIESEVNDTQAEQVDGKYEQLTEQQSFNKKYKYLIRLLDYISTSQTKNLDQNCINYMVKALNCLVRKKAEQFLDFFDKKPEVFKRLIELNNFSSISQFLIKILSDDENEGQRVEKVKHEIIKAVRAKLMESISQEDFVQRLDFLEELFQTNKYASDDDRTQLQKMSDIFSSQQTIEFFNSYLINPKTPTEVSNAVSYLICIVKRMNIDEEADPYSYSNEPKQQTMIFQVDVLYKDFVNILTKGYQNLTNLKYLESYKQKIVETKFFELLVLLTKNSRFKNCAEGKPKSQDSVLIGNNIILSNREAKITVLRQLLKQFTNQSKNGINRISLISLIEKVLSMQVYEPQNHINRTDQQVVAKGQQKSESKQSENVSKNTDSQKNSPSKEQQSHNQDEELLDGQDKKSKINKIKAGLKLNIKKFSLDTNEPAEKQEQKKEPEVKKTEESDILKKREQTLTKGQVLDILSYFAEIVKTHSEMIISEVKKKEKNHETQIGALINKVLMIFSNTIEWPESTPEDLLIEKQNFINELEKIFPYFKFVEICKNYSVTLATTKHPNASAKQKTNPELTFTTEFFKIYQTKKQQSPKLKERVQKNLEFSDSDFKSDEEEIQAVKCSIEDFKKFTGFKLETKSPVKTEPECVDQVSEPVQNVQVKTKMESPEKQEVKVQEKQQKTQNVEKKQSPPVKTQVVQQKRAQQKPKGEQKKEGKKGNDGKSGKEEVIKQKRIPLQFYIKHQEILV